jgi:signal transduction histidine kinase|uniref:Signal transduction histidine kinase subgroup 3 dimerisation and phosphoacceptor domain-containing protein n=1 Tax=Thermomicrobium roseum TaxID=500 RepID=A0A7C1FQZ0_THERO
MSDRRLRWLSREKIIPREGAVRGPDTALPSWFDHLVDLVVRIPVQGLAWGEVAGLVRQALAADLVRLWTYRPEEGLRLLAQSGEATELPKEVTRPAPVGFESLPPRTLVTGPLAGTSWETVLSQVDQTEFWRDKIAQVLVLPLHTGGRVVGRLDVGRRRALAFAEPDRAHAMLLAGMLGLLIGQLVSRPEPSASERAALLLRDALATATSAREATVRLLEAVRWRSRAETMLLVRWTREERAELVASVGAPGVQPDPAAFASARIAMILRGVFLQGRAQEWREGTTVGLLFPTGVSSVLAVPLPEHVETTRGLILAAWRESDAEGEEEARALLAALGADFMSLLVLINGEEQLSGARAHAQWLEEVAGALVEQGEPGAVARAVWYLLAGRFSVSAVGLVLRRGTELAWLWVANGRPQALRRDVAGDSPLAPYLTAGRVTRLDTEQWERWRAVLPQDLRPVSGLVAPFPNGEGAVVVSSERTLEPEIEGWLERLAAAIGPHAQALSQRVDESVARERRERALVDTLTTEERERRELVEAIHDRVLQGLASSLYRIELTLRRAEQQPIEQTVLELEQVRDLLADQIATLRDTIFRLRPASLDHLGLVAALRDYFSQLERTRGIDVEFLGELRERPAPDIEERLYRIVQIVIEQARLPAGISRLAIRLRQRRDGAVLLVLADDGRWLGQEMWERLPGIALAEEWVRLSGGTMQATGLAGGGTAVAIAMPARRERT